MLTAKDRNRLIEYNGNSLKLPWIPINNIPRNLLPNMLQLLWGVQVGNKWYSVSEFDVEGYVYRILKKSYAFIFSWWVN